MKKIVTLLVYTIAGLLLTHATKAQVINESFEEPQWTAISTNTTSNTVNVNVAGTGSINNGQWWYSAASISNAKAHTGSYSAGVGSSSASLILTPIIPSGVTQVSFYVFGATGSSKIGVFVGAGATPYGLSTSTKNITATAGTTSAQMWSGSSTYDTTLYHTNVWNQVVVNITGAPANAYLKIQRYGGTTYIDDIVITGTISTPPALSATAGQTVDNNLNITFPATPAWNTAFDSIVVDRVKYTSNYTLGAGTLALTTANIPQLQTPRLDTIVAFSNGYASDTLFYTMIVGAGKQLIITQQPIDNPANNGALLGTQPIVKVEDQYGNFDDTSTVSITAAVGAGTWTLGGTATVNAIAGVATYSGLTATSAGPVTGATITFSSSGLTGATSSTFNIPAPPPPALSATPGQTVDNNLNITFPDNPTWDAAVTSLVIDGTTYGSNYTLGTGTLTLTTSAIPELHTAPRIDTIVAVAAGYTNDTLIYTMTVGAGSQLVITQQPTDPPSNGAALGTQPIVSVEDQYGNFDDTSTASITAAVGAGIWILGGTVTMNADTGLATYTDLTATSAAAVTGATIIFSSVGLTSDTSSAFNIPAPSVLPVTFMSIQASQAGSGSVSVQWDVAGETGISGYEVEKSTNGVSFSVIGAVNATGNNSSSVVYNWMDPNVVAGKNYYRIKAISNSGGVDYSQQVVINTGSSSTASLTVYPNPVTATGTINVVFSNMPDGKYDVRLIDNSGQVVLAQGVDNSGSGVYALPLGTRLAKGLYHLEAIGPDGKPTVIGIAVE